MNTLNSFRPICIETHNCTDVNNTQSTRVKYKTINSTDVDNTHNIQCNLTANIVVQFKRLQCILF